MYVCMYVCTSPSFLFSPTGSACLVLPFALLSVSFCFRSVSALVSYGGVGGGGFLGGGDLIGISLISLGFGRAGEGHWWWLVLLSSLSLFPLDSLYSNALLNGCTAIYVIFTY